MSALQTIATPTPASAAPPLGRQPWRRKSLQKAARIPLTRSGILTKTREQLCPVLTPSLMIGSPFLGGLPCSLMTLVTPAKYNYVPIVSIPMSVPVAERAAGAYQIVNLNQTEAKNVFVGAMIKGSNIVLDPDGLGATVNVAFKVDCAAYPRFCEYHGNPADSTLSCATLPSAGTFDWRWVGLDSHTCGIGYVDSATGNWIDVPIKSAAVFPIIRGATGTAYTSLH